MTERIRWDDDGAGGFEGYAGALKPPVFTLWQSPCDSGDYVLGEWVAVSNFPMPSASRIGYAHSIHDMDPDNLKARAERWLEEFISSLGAIFPDEPAEMFADVMDEESFRAQFDPGRYLRYTDRDAGWPGERDYARKYLTPGEVYQIAWSDIGQSHTTLGLVDVEGAFYSVLFEPVDAQAPAPRAAGTETTNA